VNSGSTANDPSPGGGSTPHRWGMIARVTDIEAPDTTAATDSPAGPAAASAPGAPPATTAAAVENPLPEDRYINRELSWLDFNARVLALAEDTSLALLERAKFLAIFPPHLDVVCEGGVPG